MRHAVVIADRDQDTAGARVHRLAVNLGLHVEIKFLQAALLAGGAAPVVIALTRSETVKMMNRQIVKPTP